MKSLTRRLQRLEANSGFVLSAADLQSWRTAEMLRERRRRRLEQEGKPFDLPPLEPPLSGPFRRMSIAESLRLCRQRRR